MVRRPGVGHGATSTRGDCPHKCGLTSAPWGPLNSRKAGTLGSQRRSELLPAPTPIQGALGEPPSLTHCCGTFQTKRLALGRLFLTQKVLLSHGSAAQLAAVKNTTSCPATLSRGMCGAQNRRRGSTQNQSGP